jgi:hypothetical protein
VYFKVGGPEFPLPNVQGSDLFERYASFHDHMLEACVADADGHPAEEDLIDYCRGAATSTVVQTIERHLQGCSRCCGRAISMARYDL